MNILTPREYLVQISLISLICQPSSLISKAFCELHYGQSYIKFKTHPQIRPNGIAHFKRQTIFIPYTNDIALVFKKSTSFKNQLFLGHYQIEVDDYLKRKVCFIEATQKLIETETYVNFQYKIIDKEKFAESQTEDLSQCSSVIQRSQYSMFDEDPVSMQRCNGIQQSHSEYNGGRRSQREVSPFQKRMVEFCQQEYKPLLEEDFRKKLYMVEEIVKKKHMLANQQSKLGSFQRNSKGVLRSEKIQRLEKLIKTSNEEKLFNSLMVYVIVGLMSLFVGVVVVA